MFPKKILRFRCNYDTSMEVLGDIYAVIFNRYQNLSKSYKSGGTLHPLIERLEEGSGEEEHRKAFRFLLV